MCRCLAVAVAHGMTANERFGPVEARRHAHRVAQAEARLDVARDLRRRRRRRRDDRLRLQPARRVRETEVVGAEVVAPLRDAVRLVDDEQPDPRALHRLEERRRGEALGRDVQQAQLAGRRALERRAVVRAVALRVDERDAAGRDRRERVDLVLHERDERRDDERQVVAHERRQLVAERLPGAGRHDDEHVARGRADRRADRLLLAGSEGVEAEMGAQRDGGIHGAFDSTARPGEAGLVAQTCRSALREFVTRRPG